MKKISLIISIIFISQMIYGGAPVTKSLLLGNFEPKNDTNFCLIETKYADKENMYIQKAVYNAYKKMYNDALKEGIKLTIISCTRNFNSQKNIWERKWNNTEGNDTIKIRKIMQYSSMPGTSRHHWGTDIDFISVENRYWTTEAGLKAYEWLKENAPKYGFNQPYTDDASRTGYKSEPWHWSYTPLSISYLKSYDCMISPADINGFHGHSYIDKLNIIKTHVFGVDKTCISLPLQNKMINFAR